jgi:hypothetical protein
VPKHSPRKWKSTALWQNEVRGLVTGLTKKYGTDAVYIDEIAAGSPVLCFDPSHSHAAGGGSWWIEDYNAMMTKIRAELPPNKMLTTEANAEPYMKSFDGYLTWHWQYDGKCRFFRRFTAVTFKCSGALTAGRTRPKRFA